MGGSLDGEESQLPRVKGDSCCSGHGWPGIGKPFKAEAALGIHDLGVSAPLCMSAPGPSVSQQTVLLTPNLSWHVAHPGLSSSLHTSAFQLKVPLSFSLGGS